MASPVIVATVVAIGAAGSVTKWVNANSKVITLIIVVVLVPLVWYSRYRKGKRPIALAAFARQNGLKFSKEDPFDLARRNFHLFQLGDGRGCQNVVHGRWKGLPVKEADYWYYKESIDDQGHHSRSYKNFSILVAHVEATMPYVTIQKEGMLSRVAGHLGFPDIEFESEDFNREFKVKSEDRAFAFKLVDPRMMQWLLDTKGSRAFEVRGQNILVYRRLLKPAELPPLFEAAKAFHDHVPSLVWNEYGTKKEQSSS